MAEPVQSPRAIHFGSYTLDLSAGELHKNGTRIRLPEQPFQILHLLLQRPGEVITRDELQKKLWPADTFVDFETGLNSAVKKLRDVLGDSAETPRFIETLPRRGYRFIFPVEAAATQAASVFRPADWWRSRWVLALLALALLLATAVALNIGGLRSRIVMASVGTIDSVAVLPSKNYTGDGDLEYVADGLTDALTTRLAQVSSLTVPSVTSAMFFKGERKRLPEIARDLKVQAVVELSVQRSGRDLLINVQLIHGPTDRHLWAKQYNCDPQNIQAALPKIARDLIGLIKVRVTPEEKTRLFGTRETTSEAYALFSRGRYHLRKGTEDDRKKAAEHFAKVIELDPNYAPAYGQLAILHSHGGAYLAGPGVQARVLARTWGEKALELDEFSAEAHVALATVSRSDWDFKAVDQHFRRAIELNPNFPTAHTWYSQFLANMRRYDEALEHSRRAMELAPDEPNVLTHAAIAFWASGKTDEAMAYWQKVLDLEPNYWAAYSFLGRGYVQKGMYKEGIAALEKTVELRGRDNINVACLAHAYAKAGRRAEALKLVAEIEAQAKKTGRPIAFALAIAYAGLGDEKKLFALLERAFEAQAGGIIPLNSEQLFESYQGDPRFHDVLLRIGMPPESLALANTASATRRGEQQRK